MRSVLWFLLCLPLLGAWFESAYWVVRGTQAFRRGQARDGRTGRSRLGAITNIGIGLVGVVLWTALLVLAYAAANR